MRLTDEEAVNLMEMLKAQAVTALKGEYDEQTAADLAQDVLIEILEKDEPLDNIYTWGTMRIRSVCIDHHRIESRRREIERESSEDIISSIGSKFSGDDPSQVIEAEERLEHINELSSKLRSALWGYVVEGRSYEELAEAAGTSPATIRKRVQRAKEELGA